MQRCRLSPQRRVIRCDKQHVQHARKPTRDIARLQSPALDVVLQSQQHTARVHRLQHARTQFSRFALDPLDQRAQVTGLHLDPAIEHVQHDLAPFTGQCDQKVPRKIDAMRGPADGAAGVQPDHAECDRHALASLGHPDQVCVGEVVIGQFVAVIAVPSREQPCQYARPRLQVGDAAPHPDHLTHQLGQMRARRRPIGFRLVDAGELQRCLPDVDLDIGDLPDRVERVARVGHAPG